MSSTVVLAVPCRARQSSVASMMRTRCGRGLPGRPTGVPESRPSFDARRPDTRSVAPGTDTDETLGRFLSHCQ